MKTLIAALTLSALMPTLALAHEPRPGPNGGLMVDAGSYHAELLADGSDALARRAHAPPSWTSQRVASGGTVTPSL